MNTLGERLTYLMNRENVSGYELEIKAGVNQATISRLVNDKTQKPSLVNIEKLANYLHAPVRWLLSGEGELLEGKTNINTESQINSAIHNLNSEELMTPERFDRLLDIMEGQQKAINNLIENQTILSRKIPDTYISEGRSSKKAAGGV